MSSRRSLIGPGPYRAGVALSGALLVAGCVTSTIQVPEARSPVPALQLLGTGPLEIPRGCEPVRGAVYRTIYVVQPDGRVAGTASESGDGCVQSALRQWVSSFEYQPGSAVTSTLIDWMYVTASRGR